MTLKKSLLIVVLTLGCVLPVMSQDATATEQPTIEATLGPTATSLADLTAAPSAEATLDVTLLATLESTAEATAEVTAEATTETAVEAAAEATVEATPTPAESDTTEASSNPGIPIIVLLGGLGMLALAGGAIWWQDRDPETEIN